MKPRKPLPPRANPIPRSPVKRKPRPAAETLRIYGPPARRAWVKSLGCCACGATPCDNAHIESGGMGRKADAEKVVPLCSGPEGCHAVLHRVGVETFQQAFRVDLAAVAVNIQAAWVARASNPRDTPSSPAPEC